MFSRIHRGEPFMNKLVFTLALLFTSCFVHSDTSKVESEFQLLAEKLKGKVFFQYNKLLRTNPNAAGSVKLKIDVDASGKISSCKTHKSDLTAPDFEKKFCNVLESKTYESLSKKPATLFYSMEFIKF